jgi:hypothetical protein
MSVVSLKYKTKAGTLTAPGDVDLGAMVPLATSTVGAGGAASITLSSIPAYYEHLQIRWVARGSSLAGLYWTFNGDTGANYSRNRISAAGTPGVSGLASQANIYTVAQWGIPTGASIFAGGVYEILDYANVSKNKTLRGIAGQDSTASGGCEFISGLWMSTAAITSITVTPNVGTFQQYTSFALYGIERAGA